MKKTFKVITLVCLITLCFGLSAAVVSAEDGATAAKIDLTGKMQKVGTAAGFGSTSITVTLGKIIQAFLSLLGIIFLAYTIYAGFLWLTSAGNDEKLTKAKAILRGSIIGLIIILGAYVITTFVISRVGTATGYNVGEAVVDEDATNPQ